MKSHNFSKKAAKLLWPSLRDDVLALLREQLGPFGALQAAIHNTVGAKVKSAKEELHRSLDHKTKLNKQALLDEVQTYAKNVARAEARNVAANTTGQSPKSDDSILMMMKEALDPSGLIGIALEHKMGGLRAEMRRELGRANLLDEATKLAKEVARAEAKNVANSRPDTFTAERDLVRGIAQDELKSQWDNWMKEAVIGFADEAANKYARRVAARVFDERLEDKVADVKAEFDNRICGEVKELKAAFEHHLARAFEEIQVLREQVATLQANDGVLDEFNKVWNSIGRIDQQVASLQTGAANGFDMHVSKMREMAADEAGRAVFRVAVPIIKEEAEKQLGVRIGEEDLKGLKEAMKTIAEEVVLQRMGTDQQWKDATATVAEQVFDLKVSPKACCKTVKRRDGQERVCVRPRGHSGRCMEDGEGSGPMPLERCTEIEGCTYWAGHKGACDRLDTKGAWDFSELEEGANRLRDIAKRARDNLTDREREILDTRFKTEKCQPCADLKYRRDLFKSSNNPKGYEIKYGRDHGDRLMLDDLINQLIMAVKDGRRPKEVCDFLDEEFLFGAWANELEGASPDLIRDLRGIIYALSEKAAGVEEPLRAELANGKYTTWAKNLSVDEMVGVFWLVGEFATRMSPEDFPLEDAQGSRRRSIGALRALANIKRKPIGLEAVRRLITEAQRG